MAHANSGPKQESKKILEDLQLKKQLLQKNLPSASGLQGLAIALPTPEFLPSSSSATLTSRTSSSFSSSTALGAFIPQESYYGNSFLPVLPRLDPPVSQPSLSPTSQGPSTSAAAVPAAATVGNVK